MPTEILMPALSPTMEEGTLAKWLVKEGDEVRSGDIIAEIETDKATMEFEAVDEGTIGKLLVAEGTQGVKVNTPIAMLLAEGEDASAASAASSASAATIVGKGLMRITWSGVGVPRPTMSAISSNTCSPHQVTAMWKL